MEIDLDMTLPDAPAARTEVREAVDRVADALPAWAATSFEERRAAFARLRQAIVIRQHELAEGIARESGKPLTEALVQEVTAALAMIRFLEKRYPRWLRGRRFRTWKPVFWRKRQAIVYDPIGVVALVGPSNYPFSLVVMQACAALMCGNGVVIKPSEHAAKTTAMIRAIFHAADWPARVVEVVEGGPRVVADLIAHPAVRKVLFTGSVAAGREVAARCGRHAKPCVLELGGEGAAIVCDDADIGHAARSILWSALYDNRRSCIGTRHIYVSPRMAPALLDAMRAAYAALVRGDRLSPATDLQDGAVDVLLHHPLPGLPRRVALTGDAHPDGDETAVAIHEIDRVDDAVLAVNRSEFGLSASVWSRDLAHARDIAERMQVGMVWINDTSVATPDFPWGGVRASGWGRLYAREALPELTSPKVISLDARPAKSPPIWQFPYTVGKYETLALLNVWAYGKRELSAWFSAFRRLVKHTQPPPR